MHSLLVHFPHLSLPDQPLPVGVQRIVRQANGTLGVVGSSQGALLLAQLCLDQRGLWLQVAAGVRSVHVNGRPVRRMALLRAGDAIFVEGMEMLIRSSVDAANPIPPPDDGPAPDGVAVLRGVGGQHHGRSFALDRPRLVGRDSDSDIVIDDPAFPPRHARLERHGNRVLVRDLGSSEGSQVNGIAVRHCWLTDGDQIVFDGQHRFVLEQPEQTRRFVLPMDDELLPEPADERDTLAPRRIRRWPWLLASALLLAGVLSLLLLFGAR